ncbi:MAG: hypothetical protein SVV80_10430 [Planctomycetota bacterium]|nr:hypothetical protein [Planctomycetota bacterium]
MINKKILALGATVLATVLVVMSFLPDEGGKALGRDGPPARSPAAEVTKSTTEPENMHMRRRHNAEDRPRFFGEDRFTEDKVKEVLAFAKKHFPEEHERIKTLQKEDSRQARRAIRRLWWLCQRVRHLPEEIQAAAVAEHRLNVAIFRVRRELLQADDDAKKAELIKKLRSLLGEQFDNAQTVREYQVKRLAQQLAELKAEIEQRKADRQKIIAERLKRLMNPNPDVMMRKHDPSDPRPYSATPPMRR